MEKTITAKQEAICQGAAGSNSKCVRQSAIFAHGRLNDATKGKTSHRKDGEDEKNEQSENAVSQNACGVATVGVV